MFKFFFFFTRRISKSNKAGRCEDWLSEVKPRPEQVGDEHLTLFPKLGKIILKESHYLSNIVWSKGSHQRLAFSPVPNQRDGYMWIIYSSTKVHSSTEENNLTFFLKKKKQLSVLSDNSAKHLLSTYYLTGSVFSLRDIETCLRLIKLSKWPKWRWRWGCKRDPSGELCSSQFTVASWVQLSECPDIPLFHGGPKGSPSHSYLFIAT